MPITDTDASLLRLSLNRALAALPDAETQGAYLRAIGPEAVRKGQWADDMLAARKLTAAADAAEAEGRYAMALAYRETAAEYARLARDLAAP